MRRFVEVGDSATSNVANTRRAEISVDPYVGENGYVQNAGFVHQPIAALERGSITGPVAVVLHRTVSTTASSALNSFSGGIGTHFLIDKDGTTYQTASLHEYTAHVGPIKSRCLAEGTCEAEEAKRLRRMGPRDGHNHEKVKPYPDRYPKNEDSVGIEVVAMYHESTESWDAPTPEQTSSISTLIGLLKRFYGFGDKDVYAHDTISRKTSGEGQGLYAGDDGAPQLRMPWQRGTHP
ncbi:N-acetylmuramoyl-L-alanine amidase [Luteimonas sp. R10]|uniref:peptidoglycan recognition protein family protein n=1 Tax=Luteimonas sp. R10 TaxID=3108176 RepID=UPI003092FE21|nr:N-acetylmuramoyl-L-alanine amidase [Luteimonas sp. R10]